MLVTLLDGMGDKNDASRTQRFRIWVKNESKIMASRRGLPYEEELFSVLCDVQEHQPLPGSVFEY